MRRGLWREPAANWWGGPNGEAGAHAALAQRLLPAAVLRTGRKEAEPLPQTRSALSGVVLCARAGVAAQCAGWESPSRQRRLGMGGSQGDSWTGTSRLVWSGFGGIRVLIVLFGRAEREGGAGLGAWAELVYRLKTGTTVGISCLQYGNHENGREKASPVSVPVTAEISRFFPVPIFFAETVHGRLIRDSVPVGTGKGRDGIFPSRFQP